MTFLDKSAFAHDYLIKRKHKRYFLDDSRQCIILGKRHISILSAPVTFLGKKSWKISIV